MHIPGSSAGKHPDSERFHCTIVSSDTHGDTENAGVGNVDGLLVLKFPSFVGKNLDGSVLTADK